MLHLSESVREKRWLAPKRQPMLLKNKLWKNPFIIEFPMWAAVGISVENWNKNVSDLVMIFNFTYGYQMLQCSLIM